MSNHRRLPPMTRQPRTIAHRRLRALAAALLPALLLAACTGAPAAPAPSAIPASPAVSASPSTSPGVGDSGGGASGNPGSLPGATPFPIGSGDPGVPGGPVPQPSPTVVTPVAGLHAVHDVRATAVTAVASGGRLTATVAWWSGPSPCNSLADVAVVRTGTAFTLTVREGAEQVGIACPALAMYKAASVDLGAVAPDRYTVAAVGMDAPVTVVVTG